MGSEIKIILETAGQSNLKDALSDLKEYKELTDAIKANKESLVKATDIGNIQKVTAELKKAEIQLDALKKKSIEATEKENKKMLEQSGLIGQLIQKKKQLQGSLLGAKTLSEVQAINGAIAKTNLEIVKLKNAGVSSFNNFEKALASFQFKFNFLANIASSVVGTLTELGVQGAKALYEGAKASGVFGQSIKDTKINTEALQGALDAVEKQLGRIGKSQGEIIADALGLGLDARRSALEQALRDANRTATAGLSEEDKQKVLDQRQGIIDQLAALDAEAALGVEKKKKETIKDQIDLAKEGGKQELTVLKESLEEQIRLIRTGRDTGGTVDARLARIIFIQESILDIDKEFRKLAREADAKAKKEQEDSDKEAAAKHKKALDDQHKEDVKRWNDLLEFTAKAYKDLQKIQDDAEEERLKSFRKSNDDIKAEEPEILYPGGLTKAGWGADKGLSLSSGRHVRSKELRF